jgi:hypothetical protein
VRGDIEVQVRLWAENEFESRPVQALSQPRRTRLREPSSVCWAGLRCSSDSSIRRSSLKMDADKPHKAHRPSGKKKGKESQPKGYNEKVGAVFGLWPVWNPQPEIFYRHSPSIQADERKSKQDAMPNEIKLACMSLWLTAFRRTSRLRSSSRSSVLPEYVPHSTPRSMN